MGSEVFRLVCMNLSAQAFPNDLTGQQFAGACDGTSAPVQPDTPPTEEDEARAYTRQQALLGKRQQLVLALNAALGSEFYRPDELRTFLSNMVPLYDAPEELPQLTRAAATLLNQIIDPSVKTAAATIDALQRMSPRDGYRQARYGLGLTRAMLSYPQIDEILRSVLGAVDINGGPARAEFEDLLRATALDMATADTTKPDPAKPGSLSLSLDLLLQENDAFAGKTSKPSFMTRRDSRGLARPVSKEGQVREPFQDKDEDGRADVDAQGRFIVSKGNTAPTPYKTFAAMGSDNAKRDSSGRALDANGDPIYQSSDVDKSLLAGTLREIAPLLTSDGSNPAPALDMLYGMNALLGDYGPRKETFGKNQFSFQGPDTSKGVLFDFAYAITALLPLEQTDDLLNVVQQLVQGHEPELAGLVESMLYIKERSDLYPNAKWEKPHDFWDDLITWGISIAQPPGVLEGILGAFTNENTAKLGPLFGNWMRFKDAASYPLGSTAETKALGIEPMSVIGKGQEECTGPACGRACDLTNPCPAGLACVVKKVLEPAGVCGSISDAIAAHRVNVNYPCPNPPTGLLPGGDTGADCRPQAPLPKKNHKGIRGCPAAKPADGASCADAGGFGLCSWDEGSCTCDCEGGLCRHGAKPTWRCNDTPTPGYSEWVDRTQPDSRVGADGKTNQSLFQRTFAFTHDLNLPAFLCNKDGATVVLYDPAGSNKEFALTPLISVLDQNLLGRLFGPYKQCDLLENKLVIPY
ncbi:MAG TPA: hypothetical protein VI299_09675, partial [Polyangiales bacterium]